MSNINSLADFDNFLISSNNDETSTLTPEVKIVKKRGRKPKQKPVSDTKININNNKKLIEQNKDVLANTDNNNEKKTRGRGKGRKSIKNVKTKDSTTSKNNDFKSKEIINSINDNLDKLLCEVINENNDENNDNTLKKINDIYKESDISEEYLEQLKPLNDNQNINKTTTNETVLADLSDDEINRLKNGTLNDDDLFKIMDSYFAQYGEKYVVAHQIESYNQFINQYIGDILKTINPIKIYHGYDKRTNKFEVELEMNFEEYTIKTPTYSIPDGKTILMTPAMSRLRNFTYSSPLKINLSMKNLVLFILLS